MTAIIRWIVPGATWKTSPGFIRRALDAVARGRSRGPSRRTGRASVSSLTRWYWRDSRSPARMCRILPDVAVGLGPDELVTPRLVDAAHGSCLTRSRRGRTERRRQRFVGHGTTAEDHRARGRRLAPRRRGAHLAGRVRVNGRVVTELGTKADPRSDRIEVDGQRLVAEAPRVPRPPQAAQRRLDAERSRGPPDRRASSLRERRRAPLPGRPARLRDERRAARSRTTATSPTGCSTRAAACPKTYVLKVQRPDGATTISSAGARASSSRTARRSPPRCSILRHEGDKTWFEVTLREGRNQQIRRMGEATGFPVMRLARTSFAGVDARGPAARRVAARSRSTSCSRIREAVRRAADAAVARDASRGGARAGPLRTAAADVAAPRAPRRKSARSDRYGTRPRGADRHARLELAGARIGEPAERALISLSALSWLKSCTSREAAAAGEHLADAIDLAGERLDADARARRRDARSG